MSLPNIDLKGNPFYLDDEGLAWVEKTLNSMDEEEKIEQLLFPALWGFTEEHIDEILNVVHPSGVIYCAPALQRRPSTPSTCSSARARSPC